MHANNQTSLFPWSLLNFSNSSGCFLISSYLVRVTTVPSLYLATYTLSSYTSNFWEVPTGGTLTGFSAFSTRLSLLPFNWVAIFSSSLSN